MKRKKRYKIKADKPAPPKIVWPAPVYGEKWDDTVYAPGRHYDPLTDQELIKKQWLPRLLLLTSQ